MLINYLAPYLTRYLNENRRSYFAKLREKFHLIFYSLYIIKPTKIIFGNSTYYWDK